MEKYGPEKTPYLDIFYAVYLLMYILVPVVKSNYALVS